MEDFVAGHYVAATFRQTVAPHPEVLVVGGQPDLGLHVGEAQRGVRQDFLPAGHKARQKNCQEYESVFRLHTLQPPGRSSPDG